MYCAKHWRVTKWRACEPRTTTPVKGVVRQKIKAFLQNVHHFRDEGLNQEGPPNDRVVIFDEAQRAWNREMTTDFMRRKKGRPGFTQSEPEFLLSYLDRHTDWTVVICLVGGGQEINRGEAGISAWLDAVATRFTGWSAYISPSLTDSEYDAGHALQSLGTRATVFADEATSVSLDAFVSGGACFPLRQGGARSRYARGSRLANQNHASLPDCPHTGPGSSQVMDP